MNPRSIVAGLILVLLVLSMSLVAIPTHAAAPSKTAVQNAISKGQLYLFYLGRYAGNYKFIAEYPALSAWAKLGSYRWVPPFEFKYTCPNYSDRWESTKVIIKLVSEDFYSDHTTWVYDVIFKFTKWYMGQVIGKYNLAKIRIIEQQYSTYYKVSVQALSYTSVQSLCDPNTVIYGSNLKVYVSKAYFGTVSEIYGNVKTYTEYHPLPSLRTSMRHVDVLADMYYQAKGSTKNKLHNAVLEMFHAIYRKNKTPFDLYGNALFEYPVDMVVHAVNSGAFYDGKIFNTITGETGYDRLYDWFKSQGFVDASDPDTSVPVYPYKSRLVAIAETDHVDGGQQYIWAMTTGAYLLCGSNADEDPLYNAWLGIYYAAKGRWNDALTQWYDVVDNWDGKGIKACYSPHYSTVRLTTAIMLGTLLAKHGYIGWNTVDQMVNILLQLQWKGKGYYKPSGGNWVYIYKYDNKNGFLVSYDVAPDGSFGFTPFRPGWINLVTSAKDMDPEYIGVIPTNAETTITALVALKLYLDARY